MIQALIASNGWRIEDAEFVVVKDGLKPLLGRDLFEALGISVTQTPYSYEDNMVNIVTIQCPFKTRITNQFPQLITHIVLIKNPHCPRHFNAKKTQIANHTENIHYNPQLELRIKCDASRSGLGAALEQLTVNGWKPISFASRFLNSNEERYSINELELLGVVWSIEYCKKYLYGK